jgi:hypothetical protein
LWWTSPARGNDPDDLKSAAGEIFVGIRKHLLRSGVGSTWSAFARDTLAPLISTKMMVYCELRDDIFGVETF